MPPSPPPAPRSGGLGGWAKRHPILASVAGVFALSAVVQAVHPLPPTPPEPPRDETIPGPASDFIPKMLLAPLLKDADSAKYRHLTERKRAGQIVYCGDVASKNSFGAYTGYESFVAIGPLVQLQEGTSSRRFADLWNTFCVKTDHDDAAAKAAKAAKTAKGAHHGHA